MKDLTQPVITVISTHNNILGGNSPSETSARRSNSLTAVSFRRTLVTVTRNDSSVHPFRFLATQPVKFCHKSHFIHGPLEMTQTIRLHLLRVGIDIYVKTCWTWIRERKREGRGVETVICAPTSLSPSQATELVFSPYLPPVSPINYLRTLRYTPLQ